ncbi:FAD:protein FMN transferase [Nocardioides sp.]|uniref:FAD:protein FMN transferase n=1 Tax=Nocardioides sp. TaxID=35761 RepID=UPI003515AFBB
MNSLTRPADAPERASASGQRHVARWTALGCGVHVETRSGADLALARRLVEEVLTDVDEVASRFRDDSDLAVVNRHPGRWVEVDPLLVAAVRVALDAAAATGGLVHPLLGRPLVQLGYDRTFSLLPTPTAASLLGADTDALGPAGTPVPLEAWREIEVDDAALRIPAGTALDLGATAKAWCTDLAVTALGAHGIDEAVVSVGGDLRTLGDTPWEVAVLELPDDAPERRVEVTGALATSSTRVRRWQRGAGVVHHLLDPRTGAPASGAWRTVTAAAPTCVAANTATTAAIVLGADAAAWLASKPHVSAALLVAADGTEQPIGAWPTPEPTPEPMTGPMTEPITSEERR